MVVKIAVVLFVAGMAIGCSHIRTDSGSDRSHQRYETLIWQQSEQLQRQRENILELQQQREQTQKQVLQLVQAVNSRATSPQTSADELPVAENASLERSEQRVEVDASGKLILGQVEWAWIDLFGDSVKARIDTGAKSSILYATDIQIFERDGAGWVRFSVDSVWHGDKQAQEHTFEAPLVRKVKVKPNDSERYSRRPVVRLTTKVGNIVEDVDFVLQDKSGGAFPIVLGRSFIRDIAIVDVAQQYTQVKHTQASRL